jgi:hypothetical protein
MPRPTGRWRITPAALLAIIVELAGCASGYDPALRRDIDRRVAAVSPVAQTFPAPPAPTALPLAVGAWTQYKVTDESGRPGFLTIKLVGEDLGSYWLEIVNESYVRRTLTKMLLYFGDRSNAAAMDIKMLRTRDGSGPVVEASADQLAEARARWQALFQMLVVGWPGLPQEDASVPAGTFAGCFRRDDGPGWILNGASSRVWLHPLVPLAGLVRAQALDRPGTMELVAFGEHGAKSEIQ